MLLLVRRVPPVHRRLAPPAPGRAPRRVPRRRPDHQEQPRHVRRRGRTTGGRVTHIIHRLHVLATDHEADDVIPDVALDAAEELERMRHFIIKAHGELHQARCWPDITDDISLDITRAQAFLNEALEGGDHG